jgi:transposase
MVHEHREAHESQWQAIMSIAAKMDCCGETLRDWVRHDERTRNLGVSSNSADQEHLKALERENRELRQVNEILLGH